MYAIFTRQQPQIPDPKHEPLCMKPLTLDTKHESPNPNPSTPDVKAQVQTRTPPQPVISRAIMNLILNPKLQTLAPNLQLPNS